MSSRRTASVRRNIRIAVAAAAMKKHKRTALGKQATKTARSKRRSRAA